MVGIVTAGLTDSNSVNFGIKVSVACHNLKGLAALCRCLVIVAPAGVPVFVDGTMVGSGPRVTVTVQDGTHEAFAVVGGKMIKKRVAYPDIQEVELK